MATLKIYDGSTWVELAKKSDIPSLTSYATKSYAQGLLTPTAVGTGQTAANVNGYNGALFSLGLKTINFNGLYIFTYGNCMVLLPVYNLTDGTEYKVSAALVNSGGSYATKVLTYRINGRYLQVYNKENYIPTGYGCALFKVTLY